MTVAPSTAWCLARILAGHTLNGELSRVEDRFLPVASRLNGLAAGVRQSAFKGACGFLDPADEAALTRALADADPNGPEPDGPARRSSGAPEATFVDPRLVIVPMREDADRLRAMGFDAVAFDDLRGVAFRRVVVWWNASDAYADEHARRTLALASRDEWGALSVHALEMAAGERHTVADMIEGAGFDASEIRGELDGATPHVAPRKAPGDGAVEYSTLTQADLGILPLTMVRPRRVEWLWPNRLMQGGMNLVAGEGGLGKSQMLLHIAATISVGGAWPDGGGTAPVGRTLILAAEDDPGTTILPRLLAMGADITKIDVLTAKRTIRRQGKEPQVHFASLQDLDYWRAIFDRRPDTLMMIVDPLASYLGRGVNDSKNAELRAILEPFVDHVIRPRGACLAANCHLNKANDSKNPMHRINGSVAYANLARAVSFVVRDPDDPAHRLFSLAKCNVARDDLPSLRFHIEERTVQGEDGPVATAVPVFDAETVRVDLHEAMTSDKGATRGRPSVETPKLAAFLVEFMHGKGPLHLGAIADAAGDAGFLGRNVVDPNTGRSKWTAFTALYRARSEVEKLPDPLDGWVVVTSKEDPSLRGVNNTTRWALRRQEAVF